MKDEGTCLVSHYIFRTPERRTQESWMNTGWRKDRPEFQQKKKRRRRAPKNTVGVSDENAVIGETQVMSVEQITGDDTEVDFESLPALKRPLAVGDLFAYKIFEVGADWVCFSFSFFSSEKKLVSSEKRDGRKGKYQRGYSRRMKDE